MKKIPLAFIPCAVAAGLIVAGGLSASAQTLALQLKASNYNPTTGVWTDSSGNGDNGTYAKISGTTTTLPTLVTGVTPSGSSAVDFTAGNGSFALSSAIGYSSGYTILAYILPTTVTGRNALTGGSAGGALEYDLNAGHQDFLREYQADVANGTATISTSSFSLIDLAVSAGTTNSFNLNGSLDASSNAGGNGAFSSALTRIGNNEGGGDGFLGDIAEIDIYTGVLTAAQISTAESALTAAYATPVPEPTSMAMMTGGFGLLLATFRLRRKQA